MKSLLLGLVLLVLFVHFGGSNVPKVLKDNKQMVYGVTIGLVLCSFFGVNIEGLNCEQLQTETGVDCCSLDFNECREHPECDKTGQHPNRPKPWVNDRLTLGVSNDDPYPDNFSNDRIMNSGQCGCNNYAQDPHYYCDATSNTRSQESTEREKCSLICSLYNRFGASEDINACVARMLSDPEITCTNDDIAVAQAATGGGAKAKTASKGK